MALCGGVALAVLGFPSGLDEDDLARTIRSGRCLRCGAHVVVELGDVRLAPRESERIDESLRVVLDVVVWIQVGARAFVLPDVEGGIHLAVPSPSAAIPPLDV